MSEKKDRSGNIEVVMADALGEILARLKDGRPINRKTINSSWLKIPSQQVPWQPAGSQNHPMMWLAVALLWYTYVEPDQKKLAAVVAKWMRAYHAATVTKLPAKRSWGFQGTELGTRTYPGLIGNAWLIALEHGPPELQPVALEWLRFQLALCEVSYAESSGRVLLCGQRSTQRPQPVWYDALLSVSHGESHEKWAGKGPWGRAWGEPDRGSSKIEKRTQAWYFWALPFLATAVQRVAESVPRGIEAFSVLAAAPFTLRLPLTWLHTPEGRCVAFWQPRTINANSAPMLAGVDLGGPVPAWLPVDGGKHVRGGDGPGQGNDRATCELVGRTLVYRAKINDDASIELPAGPLVLRSSTNRYQEVALP